MKVKLPDCNKCAHKEVCMYFKNVVPVKNSLEYTTKLMENGFCSYGKEINDAKID